VHRLAGIGGRRRELAPASCGMSAGCHVASVANRRGADRLTPDARSGVILLAAVSDGELDAGGVRDVTKECSQYNGQAGSFCTITSSNLKAIDVGSKVIYAQAAGAAGLDSDLILSMGPGNSAFGHVTLSFASLSGVLTFSAGRASSEASRPASSSRTTRPRTSGIGTGRIASIRPGTEAFGKPQRRGGSGLASAQDLTFRRGGWIRKEKPGA
jgi:hypothetical protein